MEKRTVALGISVLVILTGFIIVVTIINPFRSPPTISVEGGHVLHIESDSAIVRASSLDFMIHLSWNGSYDLGVFHMNVTNIIPTQLNVESTTDYLFIRNTSISTIIEINPTNLDVSLEFSTVDDSTPLNFFVFGDSQGFQGGIEQIVSDANEFHPDFLLHCGDLTPFGQKNQYESVSSALSKSTVPVFTTPGNHDIRLGGLERFDDFFGPTRFSFVYKQVLFLSFDTSSGTVSQDDIVWLENTLSATPYEKKIAITHMPLFDPRPGGNHSLIDSATASAILAIFEEYRVNVLFSGHIHMFSLVVKNDVTHVISGGAGASLYASPENGGFYHYTNVTIRTTGFDIGPIELEAPSFQNNMLVVRGIDEDVTLSINDLQQLTKISGFSSFQNQYDNWRGYGEYIGVKLSNLLDIVGGISSSAKIRIIAHDGFGQMFSYDNIYPNESWYSKQGDMVLAYEYNGTKVPEWHDGFRIVMMPEDEAYSNSDCQQTSPPGMGYHLYPSAGARWVRFVLLIEVIV
ncbi:MAG: hypothetical protein GF411_00775 [Candidatus Lokiarchaeota archaeon]|nr:hypothetical protein [Candidatus Lokiarchaeota archaeon]